MRGIPDNVATRDDVVNLCNDLDVASAKKVLEQYKTLVSNSEYLQIKKYLTSKKRQETLRKKKAKADWARYHQLCEQIPALEADIEEKMRELRRLNRKLANDKKEKASLAKV